MTVIVGDESKLTHFVLDREVKPSATGYFLNRGIYELDLVCESGRCKKAVGGYCLHPCRTKMGVVGGTDLVCSWGKLMSTSSLMKNSVFEETIQGV
jgi:hypothetical protein